MVDFRGKMPLNINDQSSLYRSKRRNLNADLHINKQHNIFSDGYTAQQNTYDYDRQGSLD